MAKRLYKRLTRARPRNMLVSVSGRNSLWMGEDHLLSLDFTGYSESYKRFYYRDIQAIILRRTRQRLITNAFLVLLTLIFISTAGGLWNSQEVVGADVFLGMATVTLILMVWNSVAGPTTTGYLQTAVQTEEVPSLARLNQSLKALERLRPIIAAQQGQMTREEIVARISDPTVESAAGTAAPPAPPAPGG